MTEFSVPPLAVDYDGRWIAVDLHGDLHEWAKRAAADVTRRWGGRKQRRLLPLLEGAGELARSAGDASIVLLLYPVPGEGIRAIVRFCPVDLAGLEGDEAWSELLGDPVPDEPWEEPAEITQLSTNAGPCRRVLRKWVAGEGNTRGLGEQANYVWLFPQYGAGVIMTTSFVNLAEAGRWRPVLDELATAAELRQTS